MNRKSTLILVTIVLMMSIMVSCGSNVVLNDYEKAAHPLSKDVLRELVAKKVNLFGEEHYSPEILELMINSLPLFYEEGVRHVGLEMSLGYGEIFNAYVLGEIDTFPWGSDVSYFINFPVIEAIRDFNQTLTGENNEDYIKVFTFDVDQNQNVAYSQLVAHLKNMGLDSRYGNYSVNNLRHLEGGETGSLSSEMVEEFQWLTEREEVYRLHIVDDFPFKNGFVLNVGEKFAEFRENYITENVLHYIEAMEEDDKMLILIGGWHASKEEIDFTPSVGFPVTLGVNLKEIYGDKMQSISIETVKSHTDAGMLINGESFGDLSTIKNIKEPVVFIHGELDPEKDYVVSYEDPLAMELPEHVLINEDFNYLHNKAYDYYILLP